MRPDDHALGIALVLRDVLGEPIHRARDVASAVIPVAHAGMPLHGDADHAVLRRPSADVVVERVGLARLLFDLVAGAAGHVDEDRTTAAALVGSEDVDDIL